MKLFDLTGRKAIVTGGTRGLGYGMAEGLMEAGAEVMIVGSTDKAKEIALEYGEDADIIVRESRSILETEKK